MIGSSAFGSKLLNNRRVRVSAMDPRIGKPEIALYAFYFDLGADQENLKTAGRKMRPRLRRLPLLCGDPPKEKFR